MVLEQFFDIIPIQRSLDVTSTPENPIAAFDYKYEEMDDKKNPMFCIIKRNSKSKSTYNYEIDIDTLVNAFVKDECEERENSTFDSFEEAIEYVQNKINDLITPSKYITKEPDAMYRYSLKPSCEDKNFNAIITDLNETGIMNNIICYVFNGVKLYDFDSLITHSCEHFLHDSFCPCSDIVHYMNIRTKTNMIVVKLVNESVVLNKMFELLFNKSIDNRSQKSFEKLREHNKKLTCLYERLIELSNEEMKI